ncbi:hypothetical protein FACS1894132_03300 [Clostridia bacterium]|nr:hypothetical protein FACS1894132_03300 [Clostridia bacterium]
MKFLKGLFCASGGVLDLMAIRLFFTSNFNVGILLELGLGLGLIITGIFLWQMSKILRFLIFICLIAVIGFASFLYFYGKNDNVTYDETAVIIPGAGVHGEEVSLLLQQRLNTAVKYYEKNPNAVFIVTGAQGSQETVSEAFAMEKYLIEKGIPQKNIIKEEQATSTKENIKFSKAILDDKYKDYTVAIITNDFHIYRANQFAKKEGLKVTHISANTNWKASVACYLREMLAIVKQRVTPIQ